MLSLEMDTPVVMDVKAPDGARQGVYKNIAGVMAIKEEGDYVAVRLPKENAEAQFAKFDPGAPVVVKYVHGEIARTFKCRVKKVTFMPVPLVYLTYPDKVETLATRREARYPVNPPVIFSCQGKNYRGTLSNLSHSGGCIQTMIGGEDDGFWTILVPDARLKLRFRLPGGGDNLEARAKVAWSSFEGEHLVLGIAFTELPRATEQGLARFLASSFQTDDAE